MRIALFQPDIPQNTGNILRLAACFGIEIDIIGPAGFIFNNKKFKRASMDYIKYTKYERHLDWESYKKWSKNKNYRVILLTTKSKKNYSSFVFKNNDILLFGQESSGVPKKIHKDVHDRLTIPMVNEVRSLNISSAAAIVTAEALRQLRLLNIND